MTDPDDNFIWVIAHDGGVEGHSPPWQAFRTFSEAQSACRLAESCEIFRVPIWPEPNPSPWYNIEPWVTESGPSTSPPSRDTNEGTP